MIFGEYTPRLSLETRKLHYNLITTDCCLRGGQFTLSYHFVVQNKVWYSSSALFLSLFVSLPDLLMYVGIKIIIKTTEMQIWLDEC